MDGWAAGGGGVGLADGGAFRASLFVRSDFISWTSPTSLHFLSFILPTSLLKHTTTTTTTTTTTSIFNIHSLCFAMEGAQRTTTSLIGKNPFFLSINVPEFPAQNEGIKNETTHTQR